MQRARWLTMLVGLVACGSPRTKRAAPDPVVEDDPNRGCSCERLNAPIEVPAEATALARWERAAAQLATLEHAIAERLPPRVRCAEVVADDITPLLAAHAEAIRENAALNDATCDHFTRWRFARWPDHTASEAIMSALRGGCLSIDGTSREQLDELIITRGCTTVSERAGMRQR